MLSLSHKNYLKMLAVCLMLFVLFQQANGQHQHQTEYAPAFDVASLPAPPLMKNIGNSEIKITTKSETAQKYFNQGLNLLHAFWDVEAYRAFREAAKLDETCAMAYWGIYNALGQNSQEMAEERTAALKKAVELMPTRFRSRAILYSRHFPACGTRQRTSGVDQRNGGFDR